MSHPHRPVRGVGEGPPDRAPGRLGHQRKDQIITTYLLSVHQGDISEAPADLDMNQVFADVEKFNADLQAKGAWVFAGGLQPVSSAATVDATGAETTITDGPYAESKEYLGGFWVVRAADLDEALAWAKGASKACRLAVEVRPFQADV